MNGLPHPHECPLCSGASVDDFHRDDRRAFFRCRACRLIFADPAEYPSPADEKARYDLHRNSPQDPEYRRFLGRLAEPLIERLGDPPLSGLDFGCGPGPTLSVMLEERGFRMTDYDPFFRNDPSALARRYDFVTCTEAIEHFHTPSREWQLLLGLVKPGGWLGIMTRLATGAGAFAEWHYRRDPTHVSFFSRETFQFLAKRDGLGLELVGSDVVLMRR